MKRQIVALGLLIIAVCVISMIPFSVTSYEGLEQQSQQSKTDNSSKQSQQSQEKPSLPTTPIASNSDFIAAVNQALSSAANPESDKAAIQNMQTRIAELTSQNSKKILGEMSNPNNLSNPRKFLEYLNWFGSVCPITSDTCSGVN